MSRCRADARMSQYLKRYYIRVYQNGLLIGMRRNILVLFHLLRSHRGYHEMHKDFDEVLADVQIIETFSCVIMCIYKIMLWIIIVQSI